ncbi:unnamed protein product, partial [Durusdinium trenchii]
EEACFNILYFKHAHVDEYAVVKNIRSIQVNASFNKPSMSPTGNCFLNFQLLLNQPNGCTVILSTEKGVEWQGRTKLGALLDWAMCWVRFTGLCTRQEIEEGYKHWELDGYAMFSCRSLTIAMVMPPEPQEEARPSSMKRKRPVEPEAIA